MNVDCDTVLYSGLSVLYTAPRWSPCCQLVNEIPSFEKVSMLSAPISLKSCSQYSMNFSLPTLYGVMLYFFSAPSSIGRPFRSSPNGNSTSNPCIRFVRAKKSI